MRPIRRLLNLNDSQVAARSFNPTRREKTAFIFKPIRYRPGVIPCHVRFFASRVAGPVFAQQTAEKWLFRKMDAVLIHTRLAIFKYLSRVMNGKEMAVESFSIIIINGTNNQHKEVCFRSWDWWFKFVPIFLCSSSEPRSP